MNGTRQGRGHDFGTIQGPDPGDRDGQDGDGCGTGILGQFRDQTEVTDRGCGSAFGGSQISPLATPAWHDGHLLSPRAGGDKSRLSPAGGSGGR